MIFNYFLLFLMFVSISSCLLQSDSKNIDKTDLTQEALQEKVSSLENELNAIRSQLESCLQRQNLEEQPYSEYTLLEGEIYVYDNRLELRSKNGNHMQTNPGQKLFLNAQSVFQVTGKDYWEKEPIYYVSVRWIDTDASIKIGKYIPDKIVFDSDLSEDLIRKAKPEEIQTYYDH